MLETVMMSECAQLSTEFHVFDSLTKNVILSSKHWPYMVASFLDFNLFQSLTTCSLQILSGKVGTLGR